MTQFFGNDIARVRPSGRGMRIVIGPHKSVLTEILHEPASGRITEESRVDLFGNVFTRKLLHVRQRHLRAMPGVILIPFVNKKWNPADLVFDIDELELRIARRNAAKDQIEESICSVVELGINGCLVDVEPLAFESTVVKTG